jgi:endonuclease/exonuclease/phosphatase family metal-dependent hydrolase
LFILKKKFKLAQYLVIMTLFSSSMTLANTLSVFNWNLEWLSSKPAKHIKSSIRQAEDLQIYRDIFQTHRPQIIAFQEVNDSAILQSILGAGYTIVMSDRARPDASALQYQDINQYTGIAVARSLPFSDPSDLVLSPGRKLRFASYIILHPDTAAIHLLSVHLKAGCIGKFYADKNSCQTLEQQSQQLHQWIKERIANHQSYMVIGDFNHDLAYPNDWMWQNLTHGLSPMPVLMTRDLAPTCIGIGKSKPYRQIIDHIISSPNLRADNLNQIMYSASQRRFKVSDHCPVAATINY